MGKCEDNTCYNGVAIKLSLFENFQWPKVFILAQNSHLTLASIWQINRGGARGGLGAIVPIGAC